MSGRPDRRVCPFMVPRSPFIRYSVPESQKSPSAGMDGLWNGGVDLILCQYCQEQVTTVTDVKCSHAPGYLTAAKRRATESQRLRRSSGVRNAPSSTSRLPSLSVR